MRQDIFIPLCSDPWEGPNKTAQVVITYPADEHGDQTVLTIQQASVREQAQTSPQYGMTREVEFRIRPERPEGSSYLYEAKVTLGPVTRAARALYQNETGQDLDAWVRLPEFDKNRWRSKAKIALDAAA